MVPEIAPEQDPEASVEARLARDLDPNRPMKFMAFMDRFYIELGTSHGDTLAGYPDLPRALASRCLKLYDAYVFGVSFAKETRPELFE